MTRDEIIADAASDLIAQIEQDRIVSASVLARANVLKLALLLPDIPCVRLAPAIEELRGIIGDMRSAARDMQDTAERSRKMMNGSHDIVVMFDDSTYTRTHAAPPAG